jgi:hypothetical protein
MLRDENRMPPHGRLFTIIFGKRGGHPGINKLPGMICNGIEPFLGNIRPIDGFEFELRSEPGPLQSGKPLQYISIRDAQRRDTPSDYTCFEPVNRLSKIGYRTISPTLNPEPLMIFPSE